MGTRNITFVRLNGEKKVAQYCQWDGYPTGKGADVMRFVRDILRNGQMDEFRTRIAKSKLITASDVDSISHADALPTSTRRQILRKVDNLRYNKTPDGRYPTHGEVVEELLTNGSISEKEAEWIMVSHRDAGPEVLRFLMNHAPSGMTFYAEYYILNMPIDGDWQIEGVYVIVLDAATVTIAFHGYSEVYTFADVSEMSDKDIEEKMEAIMER